MYEKRNQPLLPTSAFVVRLIISIIIGLLLIMLALTAGMLGYHYYEKMPWVDAFANAAMILSGMGPLTPLQTAGGKIFAGIYAIFSGLIFILLIGIIFAPIIHRFFHKFHMDDNDLEKKSRPKINAD